MPAIPRRLSRSPATLVASVLLAAGLLPAAEAVANPGRPAPQCVQITRTQSSYSDSYRATNTCNVPVFVIYCGDTPGSSSACSGSRNSVYYSHTFILRPGMHHSFGVRRNGRMQWGACEGTIGFGNQGHFRDDRSGNYWCLRR